MPEGDTIFRTAATQHGVLAGRRVTAIRTTVPQLQRLVPDRLVGQVVERVEARGKHLLHWFAPSGMALHTHMRMTGSWHTYPAGARWRKPARQARIVLTVDDGDGGTIDAVGFSVPVVELLSAAQVAGHRAMAALGPDPLAGGPTGEVDLAEAGRRLDARADLPIGVALLDQRVLAGVGNVYANEVQFIHAVDPWTPVADVPPATRATLLSTASDLLQANIAKGGHSRITTRPPSGVARMPQRAADALWVYGKAGRPCPRCGTTIRSSALGDHARVTFWCPSCQGPGPDRRRPRPRETR